MIITETNNSNVLKKHITINNVLIFIFIVLQLLVKIEHKEYVSIIFIVIMAPILFVKLFKEIKEDKKKQY